MMRATTAAATTIHSVARLACVVIDEPPPQRLTRYPESSLGNPVVERRRWGHLAVGTCGRRNEMAVTLNNRAFEHAKELVGNGEFVADERDDWSEHQRSTDQENEYLD